MSRRTANVIISLVLSVLLCLPHQDSTAERKKAPTSSMRGGDGKSSKGSSTKKSSAGKKNQSAKPGAKKNDRSSVSKPSRRSASASSKNARSSSKVQRNDARRNTGKNRNASTSPKSGKQGSRTSKEQAAGTVPQTRAIRLQQGELERIRKEIREYEDRLAESRRTERGTVERIEMFDRQTSLIRQVVSHLHNEIGENQQEIHSAASTLAIETQRLRGVKSSYARSIVNAYKRGQMHDTELLLSSTSLNQMLIRSRYLRAFSTRQRRVASEIRERQEAITAQKLLLEEKVLEQKKRVSEKAQQEQILQRKVVEHKSLLEKVREDKAAYATELKRKQAAAAKLERLIADLIEREQAKRLAAARKSESARSSRGGRSSTTSSSDRIVSLPSKALSETAFGRLRGRLPWPLAQGRVIGGFGEQVNPKHGTVTISNGIDIAGVAGSPVRVVADGTVSMVYFIAGYGNLVIVNHDDGFFTVYAHLSSIGVREGQRVKAGQTIASCGESTNGPQIHFEIWRQKSKQNPLGWLAGR